MPSNRSNSDPGRSNRGNRRVRVPESGTDDITEVEKESARKIVVYKAGDKIQDDSVLRVVSFDPNIDANTKAHRTDEYDITLASEDNPKTNRCLVIRRGQAFNLVVEFNRAFDPATDDLRFSFVFGDNPDLIRGTQVDLKLVDKDVVKEWGAWVESSNGNTLTLALVTGVDCRVGTWKLRVDVVKKGDDVDNYVTFRYVYADKIYVLFNAWCRDDQVYLHDDALCDEYVCNEFGAIWVGAHNNYHGRRWSFGQCSGNVLDCCLYLLDKEMGDSIARGDPVMVSRKASQLVNIQDDGGILVGRWSSPYDDGIRPTAWTGSVDIFEQYFKSKSPVKYGQCWVFSGVLTTFLRALGIPTRSVTNFESAHDTDASLHIDKSFDDSISGDSVWNFHVWNECFMARPSLDEGLGGWQAVDATPQEASDGVYCCGPVPVRALKRGDVSVAYDAPFVFAEVNADVKYWKRMRNGEMMVLWTEESSVGKNISTKKPGRYCFERLDLTLEYKYPEGSEEERAAIKRASHHHKNKDFVNKEGDVKFALDFSDSICCGEMIVVKLVITNTSSETRTIDGRLGVDSMYYTGVTCNPIKHKSIDKLTVKPNADATVEICLHEREYYPKLTDQCYCNITAFCMVVEDEQQTFATAKPLRLCKPDLTLKAPVKVKKGEKFTVDVSCTNPLEMTLVNCKLTVEGPGIQKPTTINQSNIPAKGTFATAIEMTPKKVGKRNIVMSLDSDQIYDISGSVMVEVVE